MWQGRFCGVGDCTLDYGCVTISLNCVPELYHLPTFADLLAAHIARAGISDADLARRIGISRLTLIRWKEGVTSRPRYREDVLRCAELLRLTPEERDALLAAADFPPESEGGAAADPASDPAMDTAAAVAADAAPDADVLSISVSSAPAAATGKPRGRRKVLIAGAAAAIVALAVIVTLVSWPGGPDLPAAAAGESLIVIAPFANYTAGQQGFNVAGRLKDSIDREIAAAGLPGARTAQWPEALAGDGAAASAARRSGAALVIWGEYDSGRAVATLTIPGRRREAYGPQVVDIASAPAELPATINLGLTAEVRAMALLTLGQLYLERREFDLAKTALIQALAQPPSDPAALAGLRYRLGLAYLGGQLADFDEAIWRFTQVLAAQPRSADSYNSRGLAYLERGRPGDAELAVADFTRAAGLAPPGAFPYHNRAVAYLARGGPGDADRALDDLARAIDADPESAGALVNRAAAWLSRGNPGDLDLAFADLEQALGLEPDLAAAWLNRGSAYLQRGQPGDESAALADFSQAIELDPEAATGYYNRGLVYSGLEDGPRATADLRAAQEREPRRPEFNNALCWHLATQNQPARALPYCQRALEYQPAGPALDSRGLVYALMGRVDESVADFRAFLAWAEASAKPSCGDSYRPSREGWIAALEAGGNPFDEATRRGLRLRPAAPGDYPC